MAVTVLVSTALANFSWSTDHKPDLSEVLAALGRPRRTRPRHPDGRAADEQGVRRAKPPAVSTARHDDLHDSGPADVANHDHAAARRFVDLALDGGLGDHYQRAAELGTALAVEHGFSDNPQQVAEAVVVFVDPRHR
ncbi:hypothetical protein ACVGOW_23750 [Pseudonocardia saturnea]